MARTRRNRRGFTLIELLIVVGIIVILLVVLAVAILPKLMRAKENNTRTVLTNSYTAIPENLGILTEAKFRQDAGSLARKIHPDPKIASSQMLLFYIAPSLDTWNGSRIYAGASYNPPTQPESFAEFIMEDGSYLPWLTDAWDKELWYQEDKSAKVAYLRSAGPDGTWDNDDDLIYDPKSQSVKDWIQMTGK